MLQNAICKNDSSFPKAMVEEERRGLITISIYNPLIHSDLLLRIMSFLSFDDLSYIASTCQAWRRATWIECCNKILSHITWMVDPHHSILPKVAVPLEKLFLSTDQAACNKLKEFIDKCSMQGFAEQINFISNLFRAIDHHDHSYNMGALRLKRMVINLVNHPELSVVCKMALTELVGSRQLPVISNFAWNTHKIAGGLIPKIVQSFDKERIPKHFAEGFKIHIDHHFSPGELVAVIEKEYMGRISNLYYGIIAKESGNTCKIYLQKHDDGRYCHLVIKNIEQIGKFLESTPLPHFCL